MFTGIEAKSLLPQDASVSSTSTDLSLPFNQIEMKKAPKENQLNPTLVSILKQLLAVLRSNQARITEKQSETLLNLLKRVQNDAVSTGTSNDSQASGATKMVRVLKQPFAQPYNAASRQSLTSFAAAEQELVFLRLLKQTNLMKQSTKVSP
jgi:hypothetical protein